MKTATIPSLRVSPELRATAEAMLQEGETLSSFVEQSIRESIDRRKLRQAFIERGLASRNEARQSGEYYSVETIRDELDALLIQAETDAAR
jgi:predicted transcriptional regulator